MGPPRAGLFVCGHREPFVAGFASFHSFTATPRIFTLPVDQPQEPQTTRRQRLEAFSTSSPWRLPQRGQGPSPSGPSSGVRLFCFKGCPEAAKDGICLQKMDQS